MASTLRLAKPLRFSASEIARLDVPRARRRVQRWLRLYSYLAAATAFTATLLFSSFVLGVSITNRDNTDRIVFIVDEDESSTELIVPRRATVPDVCGRCIIESEDGEEIEVEGDDHIIIENGEFSTAS